MFATGKHGKRRPGLIGLALLVCLALVAAVPSVVVARPDRAGAAPVPAYLPYTEQHVLPPNAAALGVRLAAETPRVVRHGGRALLSDEAQAPGRTVLVTRRDSMYQLSHR